MKKLILFIASIWLITGFSHKVYAQVNDIQSDPVRLNTITDMSDNSSDPVTGEHIKNFDTNILLNKDGTINITEKINYDFDGLQKHGIYRKIPYTYTSKDKQGKKYKIDFTDFKVYDENNRNYSFSVSTADDYLQLKIGDANKLITGLHTYIISYKVAGALNYFSDHDELYWNATGNEWLVPITNASATVSLPSELLNKSINVVCYTGSSGSTEKNCQSDYQGNKIIFKSEKILSSSQGLTIVLGFPVNIISVLQAKEVANFGDTMFGKLFFKLLSLLFTLLILFWYIIYPVKIIVGWWRYGRDPKGMVGEARAWFEAPKLSSGRYLTPPEVGGLVDETVQIRDISSGIVDLARRGYLKIEERKKNDFYFIENKKYENDTSLLPFEKKLLAGFFSSSETTRIKDRRLAGTVQEVTDLIYEQMVNDKLFPKNPNSIRTFYAVIGVLALMTMNIPLALIAFTFGRAMPRKTLAGVDAANVAKSLKNFLTSQERQLEFQAKIYDDLPAGRQVMFEELLPYAVAFGVEIIWAERFKDINLKSPEWYSSYDSGHAFNSIVFANSLNSSMSSFRSAATPVSSTTGHSSGFSGGFSGGGGGGGGGGSW